MIAASCDFVYYKYFRYTLNTDVDTPHRGPVSAVVFAPPSYTDDGRPLQTMLVTVGAEDNKFKLWKLNHKGNINGEHN